MAPGITTAQQPPGPGCLLGVIDRVGGGEDDATVMRREIKMQLQSKVDWMGFKADILSSLEL